MDRGREGTREGGRDTQGSVPGVATHISICQWLLVLTLHWHVGWMVWWQ